MSTNEKFVHADECRAFARRDLIALIAVVVLLLVCVLLPWLGRSQDRARSICCNCNLKQVGLSFRQWALDNNDQYPMRVSISNTNGGALEWAQKGIAWPVFQAMSNELNTPKILVCPADKTRMSANAFNGNLANSNLSYFVGLDADETQPQMFLTGDSDLGINGSLFRSGIVSLFTNRPVAWSEYRHGKQGNVSLADGSVQGYSNVRFRQALTETGDLTNRIIIP